MKHLQITPDRMLSNDRVDSLARSCTALYEPLTARWTGKGFRPPSGVSWEIVLAPKRTQFTLSVPDSWEAVLGKQLATVWPRVTIKEASDPFQWIRATSAASLELKEHFMFPLRPDRRTLAPIDGILEALNLMGARDRAFIQVLLTPAPPDWWEGAGTAYEAYRNGKMPRRVQIDPPGLARYGARAAAGVINEKPAPCRRRGPLQRERASSSDRRGSQCKAATGRVFHPHAL